MDEEDMGVIADMHDRQQEPPFCEHCEDTRKDEDGNECVMCVDKVRNKRRPR